MRNKILNIIYFFIILLSSFASFSQNSDAKMQELLKEKRVYNQTNNDIDGYRIQLYNGLNETKAKSVLGTFSVFFPEITTRLIYEQPEWKVQTTTFRSELEAYKTWLKVREEFEGAFIFEAKKKKTTL